MPARSERILAAPGLKFDLTDTTRLLLLGSYQRNHFIPNPGFPLVSDGEKFRAPDIRRSLFVGTPSEDENEWEAQLEQALGDRWLATLRVNGSTQDTPIDHGRYAYGISPGGDFSLYSGAFEFDTDTWSGEIRLDGKLDIQGKPLNLTFGVDHHDLKAARTDSYAVLRVDLSAFYNGFKPETGQQVEIGVRYQPPGFNAFVTPAASTAQRCGRAAQ